MRVAFIVEGAPVTKKNSLRVLKNRRTGKRFVAQSVQHNSWAEKAVWQLKAQRWGMKAISAPVNMAAVVYREKATGDLLNYLAAVSDALEKAGIVENDRLIVSLDGSRMAKDKARPRVEIELRMVADGAL